MDDFAKIVRIRAIQIRTDKIANKLIKCQWSHMTMSKKYRVNDIINITLVICAFPWISQNLFEAFYSLDRLQNSPKRFWEILGNAHSTASAQAYGHYYYGH